MIVCDTFKNFNPRPPWGGRRLRFSICFLLVSFQSTPSVGRATVRATAKQKISAISIHALRGEGDKNKQSLKITPPKFQSTPSVGRATRAHAALDRESAQFQSTPSVGRATEVGRAPCKACWNISIHALRGEGDVFLVIRKIVGRYFNPRPPWGGRP